MQDLGDTAVRGPHLAVADAARPHPEGELQGDSIDLARVWRLLVCGTLRVHAELSIGDDAILVLSSEGKATDLERSLDRQLLERVLRGDCSKVVAAEYGLSASSLSERCGRALTSFGCGRFVARAPIVLVMAALAASGIALGRVRLQRHRIGEQMRYAVSVASPAVALRDRLSPAEYQVARLLIDGRTHDEIASARQTSRRTIANQLASAFTKIDVSGRGELRAESIRAHARLLARSHAK